jgi:hypothetical protein
VRGNTILLDCYKTPPLGGENAHNVVGGAAVEGGGEVGAEVMDEIIVGVEMM